MHSRRTGRGPRAAAAVAVIALAAAALTGCGDAAKPGAQYQGQSLGTAEKPAPQITLRNSLGTTVKLSDFRGKAVLLSFLYADCPDVCPLIAAKLAAVRKRLGAQAGKVQLLTVSVDPEGDTPARVNQFLRAHGLTGDMQYLVGSKHELVKSWRAYAVGVRGAPGSTDLAHSSVVYGITGLGKQAVVYMPNFPISSVVHDVPVLARS